MDIILKIVILVNIIIFAVMIFLAGAVYGMNQIDKIYTKGVDINVNDRTPKDR